MSDVTLDSILNCPALPSIPAVAAQVIELVGDPEVGIDDLSETIVMDQGLSAKILRTANSSFYAVRTKTTTIDRALVQLGLGAVKTLALGFTLVDALQKGGGSTFDHEGYWRRSLYTAVAARVFAERAKLAEQNEAFLGGLLCDIGMIAMHSALGGEYDEAIQKTEGDHRRLGREELSAFDLQHPDIGAMLATRWKLPPELVLPIKYHERPTAAPAECTSIVRAVGLGCLACDVLISPDPTSALRSLYTRASEWFKLDSETVDEALGVIREKTKEAGRLFEITTGDAPDVESLLTDARERMIEVAVYNTLSFMGLEEIEGLNIHADEATGALSRASFESGVEALCSAAKEGPEPLAVLAVLPTGLEHIPREPEGERDGVLSKAVVLLRKHFDPFGAVVGRLSANLLVVAIRGGSIDQIRGAAESFRGEFRSSVGQWTGGEIGKKLGVCVGLGWTGEAEALAGVDPQALIGAGVRAVQQARTDAEGFAVASPSRTAAA